MAKQKQEPVRMKKNYVGKFVRFTEKGSKYPDRHNGIIIQQTELDFTSISQGPKEDSPISKDVSSFEDWHIEEVPKEHVKHVFKQALLKLEMAEMEAEFELNDAKERKERALKYIKELFVTKNLRAEA